MASSWLFIEHCPSLANIRDASATSPDTDRATYHEESHIILMKLLDVMTFRLNYLSLLSGLTCSEQNDTMYTLILIFFDLCSLFWLPRGSVRAQLISSLPRWDWNHLILIQYWSQFCSQSGLFNCLAAAWNVLILHLVSFRASWEWAPTRRFWIMASLSRFRSRGSKVG